MRRLLPILALSPMLCFAQTNADEIATGEYYHLALRHDSVFDIAQGIPKFLAGNAIHVFAGAHNAGYIDREHRAWMEGSNGAGELGTGNPVTAGHLGLDKITTDSAGNELYFNEVVCGQANTNSNGSYWWTAGLSTTGEVYVWGDIWGGICGNGTWCALQAFRPIKVPLPQGVKAKQICIGYYLLILDEQGRVFAVGGGGGGINPKTVGHGNSPDYTVPVELSLPAPARLLAGGGLWSYAVLTNNKLYGWGSDYHIHYFTNPEGSAGQDKPWDLTPNINFAPDDIVEIKTNNEATYCILRDGSLRDWGSCAQGALGNGYELDFSRYGGYPLPYGTTNPFYYGYAQDYNESGAGIAAVIQISPVNPTPGKNNYLHICTNPCGYCYQAYFQDANGNFFFCGRDKAALCDGILPWEYVIGPTQSYYPNSWDKKFMKQVNVFAQMKVYYSPSPDCLPSGKNLHPEACNLYKPPLHGPPRASLVLSAIQIGDRWAIVADNSASADDNFIMKRVNYQDEGPLYLDMGVQDAAVDTIMSARGQPLTAGQTFRLHTTIVNNFFDSTSMSGTITIPAGYTCPSCLRSPAPFKSRN